jgi:hypothetical protein
MNYSKNYDKIGLITMFSGVYGEYADLSESVEKNWKLWIVNFDPGILVCRIKVDGPLKITHPVIHLQAEQPGCLAFNYLFSASGRKFSITQISAFDCSVIENVICRPSG